MYFRPHLIETANCRPGLHLIAKILKQVAIAMHKYQCIAHGMIELKLGIRHSKTKNVLFVVFLLCLYAILDISIYDFC